MDTIGGVQFDERKGPKFIQFGKEGEDVGGVLLAINKVKIGGKPAVRFVLEEGDITEGKFSASGERLAFLGTADLIDKIRTRDRGHYVLVRFEGVNPNVEKNGNMMKMFKVMVSRESFRAIQQASGDEVLEITDEDIPF
jgi:hypothetical protein